MEPLIARLFSARDLGSFQFEAPTPLYGQGYTLLKNLLLCGHYYPRRLQYHMSIGMEDYRS
jgi:hypothetical protein